jgi:uncharacterized protein YdhG (YjbR/CyaY superfamily)
LKNNIQVTALRPTSIEAYIEVAPPEGRGHLRQIYSVLKSVAPDAQETMKWNTPFFVEPRFLFAFSAHKAHCSFSPGLKAMDAFRQSFGVYKATKFMLKIPYTDPFPESLVRSIAEFCLKEVQERQTDSFWGD